MKTLMAAVADHIHRPYQVELLWFAITSIRSYYDAETKPAPEGDLYFNE